MKVYFVNIQKGNSSSLCRPLYIYAEDMFERGEKTIPVIQKIKIFESIAATETSS